MATELLAKELLAKKLLGMLDKELRGTMAEIKLAERLRALPEDLFEILVVKERLGTLAELLLFLEYLLSELIKVFVV